MSLSIKRNAKAPKVEGLSAGTSYPVFALTDHNAIILSDGEKLLSVGYKQINDTDQWSIVSEKLKKDELPEEESKKSKSK